jgi:hypothetical protein
MKVVVAGGSGFIGRAVCQALAGRGDEVVVLTRDARRAQAVLGERVRLVSWDPRAQGDWTSALEGADAVVGLTGEVVVGKRWTAARKEAIRASRVEVTQALVAAVGAAERRPRVFVSTSAVGFYGPRGDEEVTEEDGAGADFLAQVCVAWEAAARAAEAHGLRTVMVRNGVVLAEGGGALAQMLGPFKAFLGGPIGSGKQPFPWIHRDDVVGIYLHSLDQAAVSGPVNAVAPQAQSMKEFARVLGKVLHRPSALPVPAVAVRAMFGEGADVVLTGQRAVPRKILALGYRFRFESAEGALRDILRRPA